MVSTYNPKNVLELCPCDCVEPHGSVSKLTNQSSALTINLLHLVFYMVDKRYKREVGPEVL